MQKEKLKKSSFPFTYEKKNKKNLFYFHVKRKLSHVFSFFRDYSIFKYIK